MIIGFVKELRLTSRGDLPLKYLVISLTTIFVTLFCFYLFLLIPYWSYKLLKFEVNTRRSVLPPPSQPPVYQPAVYSPPAYSERESSVQQSDLGYPIQCGPPPPYEVKVVDK